ncbi:uncharacterized protein LOC130666541 [Microplitis mediator]|uniref:uncharacterized protein LOC130666541 n=1 Tax=Microplitis mediator TaxID=375433 RepID=UPI00255574D2|nr:uncharacterized protein LOC130666541 [Microplitis mediator]
MTGNDEKTLLFKSTWRRKYGRIPEDNYRLSVRWSCAILFLGLTASRISVAMGHCDLAELTCRDGRCVPLDAYCNGRDDCGDGSDEPALCTPCNRTYNGREGRTYELDLPRPTEARLPFLCHLTFTASGPGHGELVQLLWDAFSIGRLETVNGDSNEPFYSSCPEGSLQLAELGKPFTGGSWCGPGEGRASYYSETSTVTASIRLFHAPSAVPFEFRLRYRFISRNEAVARLGEPGLTIERGSPVPGTYCSRNFYECHKKQCRVQSPNYPGEYPRNASCLITLRQKFVPTCKHAMISIKAASGANTINNGASILHQGLASSSLSSFNNTNHNNNSNNKSSSSYIDFHHNNNHSLAHNNTSKLSVWQDCPPEKDRLVFRDGSRLEDAILLVYCGGPLPRITARGPAMLIEFRSSPLAIPLGSSPLRVELQVPVVYVDSDGLDYARGEQGCHFFINDTTKRSGILRAPQHTLPPGSVCTWNIKGSVGDRIWFYFSSFTQRDLTGGSDNNASTFRQSENNVHNKNNKPQCAIKMTLWDGPPTTGVSIVSLCDDTPRLCAHAALRNSTRSTRPCTKQESYITITPTLTLRMEALYGTALRTVNFQARYEFISTLQGGEVWGEGPCSRVWRKVKSGEVTSPKDVRLYGRGGQSKLECFYRIEAGVGERIRLTIHNVSLGDATNCLSELDIHSSRPKCLPDIDTRDAKLTLYEAPWRDVKLPRACLCDNTSHLPLTYISVGKALELTFLVDEQAPYEDFETLFFYASFELIRVPECPRKHRLRGEGGELRFVSPPLSRPDIYCEGMPWLVEARETRSLFVLTWGWFLPLEPSTISSSVSAASSGAAGSSHHQQSPQESPEPFVKCPTSNRLLLYSGWPMKLLKVVCPVEPGARDRTVHIFSEEWLLAAGNSDEHWLSPARPASLLVEFVAREPGQAAASWLEISKSRSALHRQLRLPGRTTDNDTSTADCLHTCPELGACIASSLWCDGHIHCPSGHDEANCGSGARLLGLLPPGMWLVVAVISGIVTAFACLLTILVCKSKSRAKKLCYDDEVKRSGSVPRRAPTEESLLGS